MPTHSFNRSITLLVGLIVALALITGAEGQSAQNARELKLGELISQDLSGNQAHIYRVTLSAGQYLRVVVNQQGCDAVLKILAPDGRQVAETSTPTGPRGPELISLVAESSGDYQVEVRNLDKAVSAGRYEISIEELRTANAQDKLDTIAERSYFNGPYFTASVDSLKRTIARYEKMLPELHVEVDPRGRAEALTSKGRLHLVPGDSQRSLDCLNQALSIWRSIGDRSAEALTLHSIGEVHVRRSGTQEALAHYNQALKLQQETADRQGQARTLRSIGIAYGDSGNLSRAIDYHHQSLSVSVENSLDSLLANHFISSLYSSMGETQRAFEYASRALTLSQAGDYHPYIHYMVLRRIGAIYTSLGETQKAIDCLNRRLVLSRSLGLDSQYATTFEIARLYRSLGEEHRARDLYDELLRLARATRVSTREAQALIIIADWYKEDSSERQTATDYYNRALAIWQNTLESRRRLGSVQGDAITLRIIADIFYKMGEMKKAIDFYKQSLALFDTKGNEDSATTINQIIGNVYAEIGEGQTALDHYNKALTLSRGLNNPGKEASVLKAIGLLQLGLGDKQKALDHFSSALPLLRTSGRRAEEAEVNYHIARTERDSGNAAEAFRHIDAALEIVESLRTKIDTNELRASYFSRVRNYYEFHVDLLMQLHQQHPSQQYAAAALKTAERARARSFLELLAESTIDIRRELRIEQRERENRLFANIATIQKDLWKENLPPEREQQLKKDLATAENDLEAFRLELRRTNPRYSSIQYPQALDTTLIQAELDADTALIEYALGDKRSFAWVVSKEKVTVAVLPPRKEIEERVAAYLQTLTGKVSALSINQALTRFESQSKQLYEALLQPLENALSASRKLIIVPDGSLAYLPLETLVSNVGSKTSHLLERFSISYLPSASSLVAIRTGARQSGAHSKSLIAFGDPVYEPGGEPKAKSDPGNDSNAKLYAERGFDFNRLPYTRDEVVAIGSLFSETRRQVYLGERAVEQTVKSEKLEDYRYIHFAAHGVIDEQRPARSGIALSMSGNSKEDGVLQMGEIMRLKLNADLVTLSACRTGLGKLLNGEGIVGLSRAFFYAGARSVVVSLWNVNDIATAELMKAFYRNLNKGMSKDDALRDAKLTLINGRQRTWRHPYFWAPFVLAGTYN